MTYRFKISRRLAASHWTAAAVLLAGLAACQAGEPISAPLTPPPPTSRPSADNDTLALSPAAVTLRPGDTVRFQAPNATVQGTAVSGPVEWSATGGTITQEGLYTATANGEFEVVARRSGKWGRSRVSATVTLSSFSISPKTTSLTTGAAATFTARANWSNSTSTTPSGVSWTATGGTVDGGGRYTAGSTPGTYRVIGTFQGSADTASVTVSAPAATLTALVLNPSQVALQFGEVRQFTVAASWSDGTTAVPPVVWSATGGTVSSSGQYTAPQTAGTYQVVVRNEAGTVADTSSVTVSAPTLTGLTLSPATATVNPGTTRQFSASATWSNGTTTVPPLTWTATGGTVSSAGLYTAGTTPGTFRVIARQSSGTVADTATVTIPVTVTACSVSPATATLTYGQTQQFAATVQRSDGTSGAGTATWTANGGAVSSSGLYTAGTVTGRFTIVAAIAGTTISCSATADVSAPLTPPSTPTLSSVVVSPKPVSLSAGASQQFSVSGRLSDGTTSSVTVTWSTTGGSINTSGLYTAPSQAGTYRVIGRHSSGIADTAAVTVTAASAPPLVANLLSNLPSGLSVLLDNPHAAVEPSPFYIVNRGGSTGGPPIVMQDATAPDSDPNVLEQYYSGTIDGQEPQYLYATFPRRVTSMYLATYFRLDPNYNVGAHKWLLIGGTGGWGWMGLIRTWYAPFNGGNNTVAQVRWQSQGISGQPNDSNSPDQVGDPGAPLAQVTIQRGVWYKLQMHLQMNPARIRTWVNDVLVEDSDRQGGWNWAPQTSFDYLELGSTWGGGNGYTAPSSNRIRYARTVVYGN